MFDTPFSNPFFSQNSHNPGNIFMGNMEDGFFSSMGGLGSFFNSFLKTATGINEHFLNPFTHPMADGRPHKSQFHQRS